MVGWGTYVLAHYNSNVGNLCGSGMVRIRNGNARATGLPCVEMVEATGIEPATF